MKKYITPIVIIVMLAAIGIYYFTKPSTKTPDVTKDENPISTTTGDNIQATSSQVLTGGAWSVLGTSIGGRPITAYHYGAGTTEVLFVGGIHGGYEWNTVLVAKELMDYLKATPYAIPANVRVTVIPVLNPDGLNKVVGTSTANFTKAEVATSESTQVSGRFNGNKVDLNRNFDCDWQAIGAWQNTPVSGGTAIFSEPESLAIKSYIESHKLSAVVVWYSAAGGVYASSCHNGVSTETDALTKAYATASGYAAHASFDAYPTSGDMTNWLAKIGIPTISVLLTNHTDTEWSKNLAGIQALLTHVSKY